MSNPTKSDAEAAVHISCWRYVEGGSSANFRATLDSVLEVSAAADLLEENGFDKPAALLRVLCLKHSRRHRDVEFWLSKIEERKVRNNGWKARRRSSGRIPSDRRQFYLYEGRERKYIITVAFPYTYDPAAHFVSIRGIEGRVTLEQLEEATNLTTEELRRMTRRGR